MSGNRSSKKAISRFSLGARRASSRALTISNPYDALTPASRKLHKPDEPLSAAESVLQRSAANTLFGDSNHETMTAYQEMRKPNEPVPAADSNRQSSASDALIPNSYYETGPACEDMRKPHKSGFGADGALQRSATGAFIGDSYDITKPALQEVYKPASATDHVLQRSATDTVIGIPYNQTEPATEPFFGKTFKETKSTSQDVRKSDKARPVSFGTRIRSAAGKAAAKMKSLGPKPSATTSEKMLGKMRDEQSAISLSSYPKKTHTQDQKAVMGLGPNVLPPLPTLQVPQSTPRRLRIDPLGCYPDTMTFSDKPSTPTVPRNQVSDDPDAEKKEDSDDESWRFDLRDRALYSASVGNLNLTPHKSPSSARTTFESPLFAPDEEKEDSNDESWRFDLRDRALYSASVGNLNLTPHKSPSSARTTFESPLSATEEGAEDDLLVRLLTPTRRPVKSDRSKGFGGPGRALIRKPEAYNKLPEPVVSSPLRHVYSTESFEREILKQAM